MDSLLLLPHATIRFRAFSSSIEQPVRQRNPTFSLKEITLSPLAFGSKKHSRLQFVTSSINSNGRKGGRSPQKYSASSRTAKEAAIKHAESQKGKVKSADQEEIISLFKRIQSSIAKGESEDSLKKSSDSHGNKPATESVLEIIRNSRKQTRDNPSLKGGSKPISQRKSPPRIGKVGEVEDIQRIQHFKLSRPPSNFVKRSPIPFLTAPRGKELLTSGVSPAAADMIMLQLHKLESVKLPELKELAKSRGVKGYSKLKKKELIELLRS